MGHTCRPTPRSIALLATDSVSVSSIPEGITRTLSARYYKDGSEILIPQDGQNPRRLTPRECARLMGFDDDFIIPVSDTQAYKQFGNSVVVPAITAVAQLMKPYLPTSGAAEEVESAG